MIHATPRAPARALVDDDRGAVAVFGLLMAVLLVGILWYVLGVGNAIAARERAQEAADAVAFSAAVGQARGMNTLVLINLVLSVVIGIRLIIMVIWTVLMILTPIATALAAVPFLAPVFAPLVGFLTPALSTFSTARQTQQPIVSAAMRGLGVAAESVTLYGEAVATVTPKFVARGYRPVVRAEGAFVEPAEGLPVEQDLTGSKLCGKATEAFEDIFRRVFGLLKLDGLGAIFGRVFSLARPIFQNPAGALFFCGLGGNPPELDLPPDLSEKVEKACEESEECEAIEEDQRELKRGCEDRCYKLMTGGSVDVANESLGEASEAAQRAAGVDPPENRRVRPANMYGEDEWVNGGPSAQYLAVLELNLAEATEVGAAGVAVGGFGAARPRDVPAGAGVAFAQAELYYDCDGGWHDDACNGGDEALWNFRWRARLRMVNPEADAVKDIVGAFEPALRARWTGAGAKALREIRSVVVH